MCVAYVLILCLSCFSFRCSCQTDALPIMGCTCSQWFWWDPGRPTLRGYGFEGICEWDNTVSKFVQGR